MGYSSIFWLPICAALTGLGLVLTYRFGRPRGNRAMARGAAWSLIPIAAYLTGSIEMFWKIGDAIGHFASGFVFSPVKWAGIAVAGVAVVLFMTTAGRERRKASRLKAAARAEQKQQKSSASVEERQGLAQPTAAMPALDGASTVPVARTPEKTVKAAKTAPAKRPGKSAAPVDEDMRDIEEILRNRGI